MANSPTVLFQKNYVNGKTSIFNVALTGSYAAPETFTLTSATSNPSAQTITGPGGNPRWQPRLTLVNLPTVVTWNLLPTTNGAYTLALYTASGTAFSGAYPANAAVIIEIDHDLQGY
jgi:hypothetical protein